MLLDGQYFAHAVIGTTCGAVAVVCGVVSSQKDIPNRWQGWTMAICGLVMSVGCAVMLSSAYDESYESQKRLEYRVQQIRLMERQNQKTGVQDSRTNISVGNK